MEKVSMVKKLILTSAVALCLTSPVAMASEGESTLTHADFSFDGPLGTYDKASLQRGLMVYRNVCSACHSLKRVAYRNLEALGYSEDQTKAIAA
jgi:ubiquinol-cytochrome c reductase cytochrome c1 subunit